MIALQTIRNNTDQVKQSCLERGIEAPIDLILDLDVERNPILNKVEQMRAARNAAGKAIGSAKTDEERQSLIAEQRQVSGELDELEKKLNNLDTQISTLLLEIPNLFNTNVPIGDVDDSHIIIEGDGHNGNEIKHTDPIILKNAKNPEIDDSLKTHWEIGEDLELIDFERGVKLSGSNFYLLRNAGARLQRSLISWMLDSHLEQGYSEVYPPVLINEQALIGTGQLPKFADTMFKTTDGRWLIPTAEVPVTNMYSNEILPNEDLPIHHTAYSPCFRNEQFSAGSAVRGIKRGYQFDKVEMVRFERPTESWQALEKLLENALELVRALGFKYRVLKLASKDLTFASAMTYDIEIWAPGSQEWFEVSSVSNFLDFQARRANLRFRNSEGNVNYLHTLNGSGLALPRVLAALIEVYQNKDGTVLLPKILEPYLGKHLHLF
ncbi:MAG: serine--tRNA ligase [Chloroflexi bacterium]|nr:serine--tRNA ligase [Chloroflexota bacterium]|tara:strand:+ start:3210 stop:4520 length:1311 start_codon:yes stop_codon:yes gene_type:complete